MAGGTLPKDGEVHPQATGLKEVMLRSWRSCGIEKKTQITRCREAVAQTKLGDK